MGGEWQSNNLMYEYECLIRMGRNGQEELRNRTDRSKNLHNATTPKDA